MCGRVSCICHSYFLWLVGYAFKFNSIGRVPDLKARGIGFKHQQRQYLSLLHLALTLGPGYSLAGDKDRLHLFTHWCWHSGRVQCQLFECAISLQFKDFFLPTYLRYYIYILFFQHQMELFQQLKRNRNLSYMMKTVFTRLK